MRGEVDDNDKEVVEKGSEEGDKGGWGWEEDDKEAEEKNTTKKSEPVLIRANSIL